MKHILTIAGSDSCAGAGIQADSKTINALGSYALNVITAITAQNTKGVRTVQEIKAEVIYAQLEAIFSDIRVDAVKIGMLSSPEAIQAVAKFLRLLKKREEPEEYNYASLPIILDTVMVAKSGDRLLKKEAVECLKKELLPLATLITPNLPEAEELLGTKITSIDTMSTACRHLLTWGPQWVLVKGGHLTGEPIDVLGNEYIITNIPGSRIVTNNNHGTGCTLSAAIATYVGQGIDMLQAVKQAKSYVENCMRSGFAIGNGVGILDHHNLNHH